MAVRPPARRRSFRPGGSGRPRRSGPPTPRTRHDLAGPLRVEVVSIGREILRGRIADENARVLSGWLSARGAVVHRITVVDDSERAITSALTEALGRRTHLVVTTGGLGPAVDDRTLAALSEALRLPLALSLPAREMVDRAYRRMHRKGIVAQSGLTAAREKMAAIPVGSEPIANAKGIAPGVLVRLPGGAGVLCLPGDPEEMAAMLEDAAVVLKDLAPRGAVAQRDIEAPTADEAALQPLLERLASEFPALWIKSYAPQGGGKDARALVTLEASAPTKSEAESVVEGALRRLIALAAGG